MEFRLTVKLVSYNVLHFSYSSWCSILCSSSHGCYSPGFFSAVQQTTAAADKM